MSNFNNIVYESDNVKKIDVIVDDLYITGDVFYEKDPPFTDGLVYSDSQQLTAIANGTNNQVLTIDTGVPTWKDAEDVIIDEPDGIAYINSQQIESVPNGTEDDVLVIAGGVPTWVAPADQDIPVTEGTITFRESNDGRDVFSCPYRLIKTGRLVTLFLTGITTDLDPLRANNFLVGDLALGVDVRPDIYCLWFSPLLPDNENQFQRAQHQFVYNDANNEFRFRDATSANGTWTNQRTFNLSGFSVSWVLP